VKVPFVASTDHGGLSPAPKIKVRFLYAAGTFAARASFSGRTGVDPAAAVPACGLLPELAPALPPALLALLPALEQAVIATAAAMASADDAT
jgi:hypothetical protein